MGDMWATMDRYFDHPDMGWEVKQAEIPFTADYGYMIEWKKNEKMAPFETFAYSMKCSGGVCSDDELRTRFPKEEW